MGYIVGFVIAVPTANKEIYRRHAADAVPLFREFGVTRTVETWGDDVPDGKVTDLKRAVKAVQDETVVFSWQEYPSKTVADAAHDTLMTDPRMREIGAVMPFDMQRMIFGGFESIADTGRSVGMAYVDGSLLPVPVANKDSYRELAVRQAAIFREYGALRVVEAWGDTIRDGEVTDFKRAVRATIDEAVVIGWIEWPSKTVRDEAWKKIFADPRMHPTGVQFDHMRRAFGGFLPIVDAE